MHESVQAVNDKLAPDTVENPPALKFKPHFSKLPELEFVRKDVKIEENGKVIHDYPGIEVPSTWSDNAANILAIKYLRKAGVPGIGRENSAAEAVSRIVNAITTAGVDGGYFDQKNGNIFRIELYALMLNQYGVFNSPVWFNCGLYQEYGIEGSGGNWAWDEEFKRALEMTNAYQRPQCSACFILSVDDTLDSIFTNVKVESRIFKYGSGVGSNFSKLRGKNESLSSGGKSSGLLSFLKVFDVGAGATKSGGTTRRAAKMVILDVDHPEIMDFIRWKAREEDKVKALIAAGYDSNFNGEAYQTVSGQNANNSVRLSDNFMEAYEKDLEWFTLARTDGEPMEKFKARDVMRAISEASWACADPGLQFDTVINQWHTCPNTAPIYASNPCSEFMFLDDTSCNLASLNLVKFQNSDGSFDVESYELAIRIFSVAQEVLVDFASYPTEDMARNSHDYRPLGLGYANLGAFLMRRGLAYDSDMGRAWAGALTSILTGHAYRTSATVAAIKGPFVGYETNRQPMMRVIEKHRTASENMMVGWATTLKDKMPEAVTLSMRAGWDHAHEDGFSHGFRNAQMTVLAPTGTIGLVMDCDTTGVEPDFALIKHKLLAGRGYMKIVNQSVEPALLKLGYSVNHIADILRWIEEHETIEGAPRLKDEHLPVFDCANSCGDGERFIEPMGHVRMLETVQPFISGSISKTVNMPEATTVEEIEELHVEAWKRGLKCIAIYRNNSKGSQPLSAKAIEEEVPEETHALYGERKKLPKERHGITTEAKIMGHKIFIRTGEYEDGSLGELFLDMYKTGASFGGLLNGYARAISIGLQHGVPVSKFVDMYTFSKFEPYGFTDHDIKSCTSILDFVWRWISLTYLGDLSMLKGNGQGSFDVGQPEVGATEVKTIFDNKSMKPTGETCIDCSGALVRSGSCMVCSQCGTSTGCS